MAKRLKTYRADNSFFAPSGSVVNWDVEEYGTEGLGIPASFLRTLSPYERFQVIIERRGIIFQTNKKRVMDHHQRWDTFKTAPLTAQRKFVIIPVQLMEEVGLTNRRKHELTVQQKLKPKEPTNLQFALF